MVEKSSSEKGNEIELKVAEDVSPSAIAWKKVGKLMEKIR